jgi:hypothetical protein
MNDWSHPKQLVELAKFYEQARTSPESFSDAEFLEGITKAFWPTNCWSFVEAAFAIIAPGCAMRPHLARQLIQHPIEAMIAGGLEDPKAVIAQGTACATKQNPYVVPSSEGKQWLLREWPKLESLATVVFQEKWDELSPEA